MNKVDGIIDSAFAFLERNIFPIVVVLCVWLYFKFGAFFSDKKKEEQQRESEKQDHEQALSGDYKVIPQNATPAERKKIILENAAKARKYKQALYAERIRTTTAFWVDFSMAFSREDKLMEFARGMKEHKVSLVGTAEQYKKLTGDDLYNDVRGVLGSHYPTWESIAGSTP